MPLIAGQHVLHYRLIEKIGEGGMGLVWLAVDTTLDREVAIKFLPDEFCADADRLARFEREAKLLASLNHANIASIHAVHEAEGLRFLTMEFVRGESLANRLKRGAVPLDESMSFAAQIIEALEAAHKDGVIHRDLKPANIQITPEGQIKVLDFGLAKMLEPAADEAAADTTRSPTVTLGSTRFGVILGTAAYMSPEQARGRPADKRSDLWSFGVVLYEMLTGHPLFRGETVSDTLAAVLRGDPDWERLPAATPRPLRRLLGRCLERAPRDRLQDAGDARLEIRDARTPDAEELTPNTAASRRATLPWVVAAGLLAVVALVLAGSIVLRESPRSPTVMLNLVPPAGWVFRPQDGPARLSPDGTRLVVAVQRSGQRPQLAVRRLDDDEYRILPTDSGPDAPFWSPDGRFIGFFAWPERKLMKIGVEGGPALALADAPEYGGATWNEAGVILFAPDAGPILRVSAAGGTPEPVTTLDAARGEAGHYWPHFLPGGRRFLYLARPDTDRTVGTLFAGLSLWVGSLDGDPPRPIPGSFESEVRYAAPGLLLYMKDGTLLARPFDLRRLAWRDEPEVLAENVRSRYLSAFSVSRNGVLAYHRELESQAMKLALRDRSGAPVSSVSVPGASNLDLAPDGRRAAIQRRDEAGNQDIWIIDLERGTQQRFTFDAAPEYGPVWSPNGKRLAYARAGPSTSRIYSKAVRGSEDELLILESGDRVEAVDWSPDGDWLLFERNPPGQEAEDLWVVSADGAGEPAPFVNTPFNEHSGRFSPDGRWISYNSDETGRPEVYVRSWPDGGGSWLVSTEGGYSARWSADGSKIYYTMRGRAGEVLMATSVHFDGEEFRSGIPRALFASAADYEPSPDGEFVVVEVEETDQPPITVIVNWPSLLEGHE